MKRTVLAVLAAMIVLVLASAPIMAETFDNKTFNITFPDSWKEIPTTKIREMEAGMRALAPNAPPQHFDYGYQLKSSSAWFEYPYALVKINVSGRIPEAELSKIATVDLTEAKEKSAEDLKNVMSEVEIGQLRYDPKTDIIWMKMSSNVADVGPIIGLSGLILTSNGFIQVACYSIRDDFEKYMPIFNSIIESVQVTKELRY